MMRKYKNYTHYPSFLGGLVLGIGIGASLMSVLLINIK
jgi:hypothetical protein